MSNRAKKKNNMRARAFIAADKLINRDRLTLKKWRQDVILGAVGRQPVLIRRGHQATINHGLKGLAELMGATLKGVQS